MSKAEDYIREKSHIIENPTSVWISSYNARKAVEIAREEIYEWLKEHSKEYVYWMDEEFGKEDLINDLKKYLDGKV